jgi:hypothetical protein
MLALVVPAATARDRPMTVKLERQRTGLVAAGARHVRPFDRPFDRESR